MATFAPIIEGIREQTSYTQKNNFLAYLLNAFQGGKVKANAEDKKELAAFALAEVSKLLSLIPSVTSYKEKDEIFCYEDSLLGIVMLTHNSPAEIPAESLKEIRALVELVQKERFVEDAVDAIFKEKKNAKEDVERLLECVRPLTDEYHRGQVFQGLLHYKAEIGGLPTDSKQVFGDHIASEISRYLRGDLDDTILNNLEVVCDLAKYFANDTLISLLYDVLKLGKNHINYYALETLLEAGKTIPDGVVTALAKDLVYAGLTYSALQKHNALSDFPAELATPEYLAKSDLVHWLVYPTELGQEPDEIEYLGKVKTDEEYSVFRFKSVSDTLSDDLKGQWLIGWSGDEGGTFSNFDLYADYEEKTVEKTLKKIKKKLLK